jgi:hypothetical protein
MRNHISLVHPWHSYPYLVTYDMVDFDFDSCSWLYPTLNPASKHMSDNICNVKQ